MKAYLNQQYIEQIYKQLFDVPIKMPLELISRAFLEYLFQKKFKFLEDLYENLVKPPV